MRKVLIDSIKGTEILAKDVFGESGIILMTEGTLLKKDYIPRLKELDISYIYIEDELAKGINEKDIIEIQIKEQCQDTIRETMEKYLYTGNAELQKLRVVAEEIIYDLLEKPKIMFNMAGVRQRSESVYSHSVTVCALSVLIGLKMKLSKKRVEEIAVGSLLHDIGFNYIPLQSKDLTNTNFSEKEIKNIKKHVVFGYSAVEQETWLTSAAKEIILSHHERIDGSGYPMHLTGDRMKIGTKIVAVCDTFDRLVYGYFVPSMKIHAAIEYIVSQSGITFDKEVVKLFNESVAAYPNGTIVLTNEDEIGIVLRQNYKCPTRPIIRMIKDNKGNNYDEWIEKDLTKELTLFIQNTMEDL